MFNMRILKFHSPVAWRVAHLPSLRSSLAINRSEFERRTGAGIREPTSLRQATGMVALDEWQHHQRRHQARFGVDEPFRRRWFPELRRCAQYAQAWDKRLVLPVLPGWSESGDRE